MKQSDGTQSSLADDIGLKIASLLEVHFSTLNNFIRCSVLKYNHLIFVFQKVTDLCALGSCSRFWRSLCGSECIWESLVKERWTSLTLFDESSSSTATKAPISKVYLPYYSLNQS